MALLTTRILLLQRFGVRGGAAASTSTVPSGFLDVRRRLFGTAVHPHLERRALYSVADGRIRYNKNNQLPRCQNHRLVSHQTQDVTNIMSPQEMASQQTKLLNEASYLTRTLYRKCLQSINLLAKGNERDEDDFSSRETKERNQFSDEGGVDLERISMSPPVNRQNELSSRANYYKAFARENFDGHWNLLGAHGFHIGDEGNMTHGLGMGRGGQQQFNQYQGGHHHLGGQMSAQYQSSGGASTSSNSAHDGEAAKSNDVHYYMWREEQIEQFVYLIKSGEEKRQWILNDYEFEDPCRSCRSSADGEDASRGWSRELEDRLKNFEAESNLLVREMYRRKGWVHSGDHGVHAGEDDDFFSDSDSDDNL
ncbi:hypothetical protein ACHAXR_002220 [Thalassiosira sp. AJA248-18]